MTYASPVGTDLDTDGWTTFAPSDDTRIIYVSNSGSDTNDGLSAETAVATVAKGISLLRNGSADWLLLESGGVWHESINWPAFSGRSPSEPILISSYGEGERPIIASGSEVGFANYNTPISNLAIVGLDFYADTRDPNSDTFAGPAGDAGIKIMSAASNILIEDTVVRFYPTNVVLGNASLWQQDNITLHRNIITDAYSTFSHSQGLYADMGGTGLVLDGNLFDHNGWNENIGGAAQTIFNHNVYINTTNGPATLNDNIFANASSHGVHLRDGGTVTNNLFVKNPISLQYGYANHVAEGGFISNNVFTEGNDGHYLDRNGERGWGLYVLPTSGPVEIVGNIFTHDASPGTENNFGITLETSTLGISVRDAIFYRWDNPFVNRGSSDIDMSTIQINQTDYPDPSRLVSSYYASLGYSADLDAFLAAARLQSKDNWNPQLTADGVNDYMREGFGIYESPPTENHPPIITSDGSQDTATISTQENAAAVTTVTATDSDSDKLNYSILGGVDASLFTIDSTTGALAFIKAPDYEHPADVGADNTYQVTVQASDGELTASQSISVNVTNLSPETLTGDGGDNLFIASADREAFSGLAGNDTVSYALAHAGVAANLVNPGANTGDAAGDTYNSIENLIGSPLNDNLIGDGNINVLEGGAGADQLNGGNGSDTASYEHATSGVTANLGRPSQNRGEAAGDSYSSIENLLGSHFNDQLVGNRAANVLLGGDGNDTLIADRGNDTLIGGLGADSLTGGAGKDLFVYFSPKEGGDTIQSFSVKDDTIGISASSFGGNLVAGQNLVAGVTFNSGTSPNAPTPTGTFLYNTIGNDLLWDADGSGPGAAEQVAHFDSAVALKADDFKIMT